MKINQDIRVGIDSSRLDTKQSPPNGRSFQSLVRTEGQKLQAEQLAKMFGDIEQAGARLARSRNARDLAKYKNLVKKFVEEAVEYGFDLKQSHTWNQFGEGRHLKIVRQIDEMLISLTEDLLDKEKPALHILNKIGEVKGLLINLYT
ncbi:hypothetical protein Q73_16255 [Bacillus coahuilensis m2-6]|uniref:UDP-N-acetylenolpyruvoylglucosamine reductase n=1 Tax=Bacillus coahuilensis p1.1.43 TaxID=1150625 RepID=A0A147K507_9BACI|nr:YaaR family protein [Bacillus coahuilensis]KUP04239.1 hypothetical protein Q73_16255 [Bacillus coahuilensis m2-6]KUP04578.1 hypothetical protein Q75_15240 [Bacillus coahuilensis p1.1.43]